MGRLLRFVAGWVFTTFYWVTVISVYLLCLRRLPARWLTEVIQTWGRVSLWILGIRVVIENESTIGDRAARVVIVNHQSALDVLWGALVCPLAPLSIGKKEVAYIPVFNVIWWALGFIFVDRSDHAKAIAALQGVSELIVREKRSLMIAPEGTRTPDGSILRFKKGAFHIARQAGVPVCPIVVTGAYELLPKRALLPRKGVIRVRFLAPVSSAGIAAGEENEWIERIRGEMIRALQEMRTTSAG